jgi:hypothetical protein
MPGGSAYALSLFLTAMAFRYLWILIKHMDGNQGCIFASCSWEPMAMGHNPDQVMVVNAPPQKSHNLVTTIGRP